MDGKAVGITTSYKFEGVDANHTIEATFKQTAPKPPVEELPTIHTQPQSASVKAGEQAVFTITASGSGVNFRWQVDKNDGNGFVEPCTFYHTFCGSTCGNCCYDCEKKEELQVKLSINFI